MGDLLSPEEVAARLRLSRRTVIVWLQQGRLPGIKVGSRWRIRADDLDAFVEPGPDHPIRPAPSTTEPVTPAKKQPAREAGRTDFGPGRPAQRAESGSARKSVPATDNPRPRTPEDPGDPILNVIGCITAAPVPAKDINKLVYGKEDR